MLSVNTMTGGCALQLCENADSFDYHPVNRFQCCVLKAGEDPSVSFRNSSQYKAPLSPLDNLSDSLGCASMPANKKGPGTGCQASKNTPTGGTCLPKTLAGVNSIQEKISQWEGKKNPIPVSRVTDQSMKELDMASKKDLQTIEEKRGQSKRSVSWNQQDSGKENAGKMGNLKPKSLERSVGGREQMLEKGNSGKPAETLWERPAATHMKKLDQTLKEGPSDPPVRLPGSHFCPYSKEAPTKVERETSESIVGSLDRVRPHGIQLSQSLVNSLNEPSSINPLPKPQRTFQHPTMRGCSRSAQRNLPPLPSIPPPPLLSCPNLGVKSQSDQKRDTICRKSKELEELLQCTSPDSPLDWYGSARLSPTNTLSQENIYEDILDPPVKENPYEDIEVNGPCPRSLSPSSVAPGTSTKITSRPGLFRENSDRRTNRFQDLCRPSPPSTPSSPENTPRLSGDLYNRRWRRTPKMVQKINSIFEARRGKKRVKRFSQTAESSLGRVTDDNSETDSDIEEKLKAESLRLVSGRSKLRQASHQRSVEWDTVDPAERKLFEYFLVVALQRAKVGVSYLPEVTQQFPLKFERSFKFIREAEDQVKVIPQFCFPDAKDWVPVDTFPSETFSFVLTDEDGSRRFGYCRRLLPSGKGRRLPEVYCMVSRLGCFDLFSKILDEVERRRALSPALVQPFMRGILEAPFPAPGKTITIKSFMPGFGTEVMQLCRPSDSRLEHVDFECLFSCLSVRLLLRVFASLLLERRVIFTADRLSTLSQCCHAVVALLYPFAWQHTYIPVLPASMLDIVCSPTPYIVGLLSSSLPRLKELPIEEVLVVDLGSGRFLRQLGDEDAILPHKLQAALEHILEKRVELAQEKAELLKDSGSLSAVVSEAFVRFFVEMVGHYPLFMGTFEREEDSFSSTSSSCSPTPASFQSEAFHKAVCSRSLRRFLEVFMETQMFAGFIQEREMRRHALRGLFETRTQEYLDSLPWTEHRGVNKFLKGLGNKMKFLSKK
ncbi:DENN domain-containing protein 2A isoform X2 [Scleropages formosus]|uniref:DENN domain-containing protein 2A isoform X2 n=1 Tax=Scleropages formosus TaxID=113540 RepID=UPI0010FA79E2|nr:DENN domain-containing protein 2A-like isoform X2 [Scleropages formosus]